ncbi:MAG: LPS export ABC transporter permease LptF [Methylomonas sp.]|nr:MAG: LPS export ABC transporter permease LptF [Methylomonas sp.]PPD25893.1 MAG: LPS export ABC transporter permease LptF [Methylomonas sp.]PPD37339.1 MAG: LPS export ABC transporter permease LptF [Methylomonas sp.]PPD40119.1 MAG: LPS export ABC transporter permease LptF [Methylomonas sp.]PPD51478.1 MAG: LPS export ABC transporter permease LptF [Methylomonas sp.]
MSSDRNMPSVGKPFRLFTVLDRMIVSDLYKTFMAVLAVLVIIIVSRNFIKVLVQAIEGNIANDTVMMLLGLKIIVAATAFLPAALFMAVFMVLGRMYRDHEISAIASAGGGIATLYRAVFWVVVPLSVCAAALAMYATPWAEAQTEKLMHDDRQSADVRGISAGRFSEYSSGELIFYTEAIANDGTMRHVFVQNRQGDRLGVINANQGRLQYLPGGLYLILQDGERVQGVPGQNDFIIEQFREYAVLVEKKTVVFVPHRESAATESLWQSDNPVDIAELQDRVNTPSGVLLLAFLAVPLARLSPRGGIYGSLLIAFGIYFVYGNLQRVNHSWVVSKALPGWLGYVWVDAALLLLGFALLARFYGWQWLKLKFTGKVVS